MKAKWTDPPPVPAEIADVVSRIFAHEAKLVEQAEAGLLLPWQQEELAIVHELLRNIRQAWRGRLQ